MFRPLEEGLGVCMSLRTNGRNFGFADSSKLAMQWCACSKHIKVMPWFACSRHRVAQSSSCTCSDTLHIGFIADSSRLAMQSCACSKHIRVMQWLHVPGTELLRVQVANAPTPIGCRQCSCHLQTRSGNLHPCAYLLGLLAMIKCSICSYQCDN